MRAGRYSADDPFKSTSHGRPTALWCLAVFGPEADHEGRTARHMCNVDLYRHANHVHSCRCGAKEST